MSDQPSLNQVFSKADDALMSDLDDLKVIMSISRGQFMELNATGKAIWERLDGKRSLEEIAAELHEHYDVDADVCEADVVRFIGEMQDLSLVVSGQS